MSWEQFLANPNTGVGAFLIVFIIAVLSGRIYGKKQHNEILDATKAQQEKTEENNKLLRALLEEKNEHPNR